MVIKEPEPLALEVKLYCPKRTYPNGFKPNSDYAENYLKQGFDQLHQAVVSYGSGYGVLFVFNLSDKNLIFDANLTDGFPSVMLNGKTYYILHADLYPHLSDSKAKRETKTMNASAWLEDRVDE